ncbi:XdhC family protein [Mesorhizobium sp. SB112]|uniref:XdhC family protein n=1 Tax=Mesorhizobium sp. SB112 TaxID=3151853 RepID=UPI0032665B55
MDAQLLSQINAARKSRQAIAVLTDLTEGKSRLVNETEARNDELGDVLQNAFRTGRSLTAGTDEKPVFINMHLPSPRLVVIGAVHISQALAPMARIAGYPVEIIDPRSAFASEERFPEVSLHADWPETVLQNHPLDSYCALAAITHDPKIDDFALKAALDANCFYVGALGSRKTHAKRVERLLALGATQEQIERIKAPIGLNIGAANPAEIAVATLSQIIEAFRTRGVSSHEGRDT